MKLTLRQQTAVMAADGILLFLGLYGTLFSFLSAFRLAVNFTPLILSCLLAALAGLFVFSLPKLKYRLPLASVWLLWLGWMVWRNWESVTFSALAWAQTVGEVFARKLGGLNPPNLYPALAAFGVTDRAEMLEKITLFAIFITALLGLWLGFAVVRRRSFWLGLLFTFPVLLAPLCITVTPDWLPLTVLLLFWCATLLTRLPGRQDPYGGAKFTLILLPLAALFLTGLRLALPQKDYRQNAWANGARLELISRFTALGQNIVDGNLGSGLIGGSVEVDLTQAGPLRYTGKTVLRVESETTGHIYLRGFSSATYTEKGWEQLDEDTYKAMREGWETEGPNYLSYFPGMGEDFQPLNFPALADSASPSHCFTIESIGAATPYVFTPYQLSTTPDRMSGAEFVGDSYLARGTGIWRYVLYAKDKSNPEHGAFLTGEAALAERAYRDFAYEHYTQIPAHLQETLRTTVINLGQTIIETHESEILYGSGLPGASLSRLDAAKAVADYLSDIAVYDAETPRAPLGEDFVEYFLTQSGRGYCMHFASAATLILRSMGVPARYVSGYTADVKAGQSVPVPDQNAHAWVEVYCDGYGWQPVEVTPGFSGNFPWSNTQAAAPSPTPTPSQSQAPSPTPSQAPHLPTPGADETDGFSLDLRPLLALAAAVLLVQLIRIRRQWMAKRRRLRFAQSDTNRAVISMYLYDQKLLRYHPGEEMSPIVHALGEKAKFSLHTLTEDERRQVYTYTAGLATRTDALSGFWRRLVFRYLLCLY